MRYLSECLDDVLDSARIERKFIMTKGQCTLAESLLKSIGFKRLYDSRSVSSIYFDDVDHNYLRANVDGSPSRDKIRIRTYDKDYERSILETKHKRGAIGYKATFSLDSKAQNQDQLIDLGKNWCDTNLLDILAPSSQVDYVRSYYIRDQFRATVDFDVTTFRIVGKKHSTSAMYGYSVIEFKYSVGLDDQFRSIYPFFSDIALHNTKSSKYSNSLLY